VEKEVQSVTQELLSLKNQQFQTKTWITNRTNQIHGLTITQENIEKGLLKNREELSSLQAQIKKADEVLIKHKEQLLRAESEFQLHRTKQNKVQENRRKALEEQGSTAALLARLEAEKKVLIQAESQLAGYASGTKEIFNAARKSSWLNIRGAVSQFLQVPKELEVAIASVLGDFSDAVVLESYSDEVLDLLKEKDQKGSIIPLRNIRLSSASNEFKRMEGVVGFASELCQVPEELVAVKNLLLSGVIIVEDRQAARRVMAEIGNHAKMNISQVVTLQGEIFYSTGAIKSSGRGMENKTVIGRTRQIKELEAAIQAEKDQVDAIKKEIARLEEEEQKLTLEADTIFQAVRLANKLVDDSTQVFNKVNQKYEILAQQISWQESQLEKTGLEIAQAQADLDQKVAELEAIEEKIVFTETKARENSSRLLELSLDEFQEDVSRWNTNVAVAAKAIEAVKTRIADLNSTIENQKALKATMENQLQQTSLSLEAIKAEKIVCIQVDAEIQQKIADLQSKIEPEETEINHLEKKLEELEEKELIARQSFTVLESHASQARSGFARRQESLDSLRHRIEEDFGLVNFEYTGDMSGPTPLPLEGMVEKLPNIKQLSPEIEEAIKRQRAQLRRIGLVNPEVLEEYNEVQGRFNFLTEQVADLEKADFDIRKVIQDLDLLMQNEFRQVFDQVAVVFREYFSRLFGGGSARLILTDPEDLTETGVEIEARLPGRRMQGLSLLSGGERSLTAVALVFALLKVSPTPFCLLDEVDAMLDEANVHRFRELLKELSQNTQFVIVTHNRNTVQVADYIFGVTLGRDLASQVLSLRLDEISKVVGEEV
jgi:chromosome segregation protein